MKKRMFFCCLAMLFGTALRASDTKVDGFWYDLNSADKTASVTFHGEDWMDHVAHYRKDRYSGDIVIPDKVNVNGTDYKVTGIGDYAFFGCNISSIRFPKGLKTIGDHAFEGVKNDEFWELHVPEGVTSIGACAFSDTWFFEVELPNSVTSMGWGAFWQSAFLAYVNIPNQLRTIPKSAFSDCGIEEIEIPNSVTRIEESAFSNCYELKSILIPNRVSYIGSFAFGECKRLEQVVLGAGVQRIETCFSGCDALKDIVIFANRVIAYSLDDVAEDAFGDLENKGDINVYVAAELLDAYKADSYWKDFNVQVIGATTVADMGKDINVLVTTTAANVTWSVVTDAETYELTIKEKNTGNVIYVLKFDKDGYLLSMDYRKAPSRLPQGKQEAGFSYTITGLDPHSEYTYELVARDEHDAEVATRTGSFTTNNDAVPTGVENVEGERREARGESQKVLRDGKVYLLFEGRMYDLQGREIAK